MKNELEQKSMDIYHGFSSIPLASQNLRNRYQRWSHFLQFSFSFYFILCYKIIASVISGIHFFREKT